MSANLLIDAVVQQRGGPRARRALALFLPIAACSSPTPATSSSSNWATCTTVSDCASVSGAVGCTDGYCVDVNGARVQAGGTAPGPCDPLAAYELPPVVLGTVLGIGKDGAGTIYMADSVPAKNLDRVFVSGGDALYRKRVVGSGSNGGGTDVDYSFTFEEGSDAGTARALLIQRRGGALTAMALGPANSKGFIGDPGATTENLILLDPSAISGRTLRNLPGGVKIDYVADVANGDVIVVTEPTVDPDDTTFRLFYGTESKMVERKVVSVSRTHGASADFTFTVDGATYIVHFSADLVPSDGGVTVRVNPGSLDTGSGTVAVTERLPVPTTLPGFSFTCL